MKLDTKDERRKRIEAELASYDKDGKEARFQLDFRGERQNLKIVRVNPSILLFNPQNSRIWTQLDEHSKASLVRNAPDTKEAQDVVIELLRATEKYSALRDELKAMGQMQPGVITIDGKLVNGNTRAAALLELGIDGIDVAVLPPTAGDEDLVGVEMSLQMTQLTHQDYSFANQLTMMRRFLDSGKTEKELAEKMAWIRLGEKKVREHMRYLDLIEEVRELSPVKIPYRAFDKKREHLKNLDDDYRSLRAEDSAAAEDLKWTRLTALVLGINKDQIRAMDEDFMVDDMKGRLDNSDLAGSLEPFRKSNPDDDGLGDLLDTDSEGCPYDMRKILAAALSGDSVTFSDKEAPVGLATPFEALQEEMRRAADDKILREKRRYQLDSPVAIVQDIRSKLSDVSAQFETVLDMKGFKEGKFKYQLRKLEAETNELIKKCEEAGA